MALHLQRLFRFLRSIQYLGTVFAFSCLLIFIFILYQPSFGPGAAQRLGWQSWDTITTEPSTGQAPPPAPVNGSTQGDDASSGVDWWNVTRPEDDQLESSLPLDIWSPLLPHSTCRTSLYLTLLVVADTKCIFVQSLK